MTSFRLRRRVEFAETDAAGILHFSNYFRLMEEAEHALFRALGRSVFFCFYGRRISWPRVKASLEFLGPLGFEDECEVELGVEEIRNRSLRFACAIRRHPTGELVARGEMVSVCVAFDSDGGMSSIEIPTVIREAFDRFGDNYEEEL